MHKKLTNQATLSSVASQVRDDDKRKLAIKRLN
jgi:hypothetical protein